MAPYSKTDRIPLANEQEEIRLVAPQAAPRKFQIIKTNLLTFGYGHLSALYGLYLCFTEAKWQTLFMTYIIFWLSSIGVTAGAHRLWAHKSYKAKMPLQIILMVMNTFAFQNSAINWVRDHRLHHKYSDTDADPHNATRGFFYSHIGWLLVKKHDEVKKRGKTIDMSDIYANPVLRFQKKYAIPFIGTVCFALPTLVPVYFWGESLRVAWHIALMRYITNLHTTFLVNSAAHIWGNKPYDKSLLPSQNKTVSFLAFGEGFHNYHHVFPWDYKTAELGNDWLNVTTMFIDFFAKIGWAYDLKAVTDDIVLSRAKRTGDGTYEQDNKDKNCIAQSKRIEAHKSVDRNGLNKASVNEATSNKDSNKDTNDLDPVMKAKVTENSYQHISKGGHISEKNHSNSDKTTSNLKDANGSYEVNDFDKDKNYVGNGMDIVTKVNDFLKINNLINGDTATTEKNKRE